MKKKVLFVIPSFNIGGTTVSVRNLISLLEKEGYDCWIMPLQPQGQLSLLYDDVKKVKTSFVLRALSISSWKNESSLMRKAAVAIMRFMRNHVTGFERIVVGRTLNKIIKQYSFDTIVAGQESVATRFVSYCQLKNKVAWVRCDYKRMLEDKGIDRRDYYSDYKAIVCVSDRTCDIFKGVFPEYSNKTYCIPNPQDSDLIINRSKIVDNDDRFKLNGKTLISIGRLDAVKRFDKIVPIAKELCQKGLVFRWYLLGEGAERSNIEKSIKDNKMEDCVIMLGAKDNPYYYLKQADALVCLSRSEACPRVVNEAKILHVPTISTDFPTIFEFIQNGKTGIISSIENIPFVIKDFFEDTEKYETIKNNIGQFSFDNKELMDKITKIVL